MTSSSLDEKKVIELAHEILKQKSVENKSDTSWKKLKDLTKIIAKKLDSNTDSGRTEIKGMLISHVNNNKGSNDCLTIDEDEKVITFKAMENGSDGEDNKKRKIDETKETDEKDDNDEDKAARKKAKKEAKKKAKKEAKKEKKEKKKKDKKDKSSTSTSTTDGENSDILAWRKENKIILKNSANDIITSQTTTFVPMQSFHGAEATNSTLAKPLLTHCTKVHKYTTPSPIQAQTWPTILSSSEKLQDTVGIAETGSGKTLAFSLPALSEMYNSDQSSPKKNNYGRQPRMLVLAPTRELAMQCNDILTDFGKCVNLTSVVIYGGVPKYTQVNVLKSGVDCVVATPGRLKDLVNEGLCKLSKVSYLVLDEADRMLDMGFEEDVRYLISQTQPKENRCTVMFSATWPAAIQNLAGEYMIKPVRVYVGFEAIVGSNGEGDLDDSLSANVRVKQTVEVIEDRARESRLHELLQQYQSGKNKMDRILVFALYKKEAQRLENNLSRSGYKCCSIHGDKSQEARTKALSEFKSGINPLLVATDVAARGLDIPNVELVVNYTFPLTIEDYVHRIGRTGRAGKLGKSYTFFQVGDKSHAGELQQVMKQAGQDVPEELMKFGSTIKKKEHNLYGNFGPRGGAMKKATKITFDDY
mmetsp:Transcript_32125/g.39095  ORF Transcript_32125/g.39095 Transcript_32125/m.39095 type:complete len:643 (-) Transcript_32125:75-2003(-)